jgi:uncharacterized protein YndB with AHSA1/START domain
MTRDDDGTAVRVDQFLAHPPARVWRALTDPGLLAQWLMPGDFKLVVGHRYTMHAPALPAAGFSGTISAQVLAFEPEKMLRIGWRDADPDGPAALTGSSPGPCSPRGRAPGCSWSTRASTPASRFSRRPARSWPPAGARTPCAA